MPIEDGLHFKLLPDLLRINASILVTEHRAARFHGEFGKLRRNPDAAHEILKTRVGTQWVELRFIAQKYQSSRAA